jgi:trigger factor
VFEVSKEVLDTHEALLTVEIDEQTTKKEMQKIARDLSRRLSIPGFRKGKVPYHVMVRRIGEDALRREVADKLIQEIYPEIIERAEIAPYASGGLEDLETTPLTYKIRIPLRPEVDLGDYRALRTSSEEVDVTEEEVDEALEEIRREQAVVELVERSAQLGDEVQVRVSSDVGDIVLIDQERASLVLDEEDVFITPGFIEAIIGMEPGEEKTFTLTLDEEFEDEDLRGEEATFTVKLFEVYDRKLPELDDALASVVGPFETIDELRDGLRERMIGYKQAQTKEAYMDELVEGLLDYAEVKYPPDMVDDEVERMVEEIRTSLQSEQGIGLEDALRLQGQTMSQLQEGLRPQAERRVEISLVMSEFIQHENLEVTQEHIQRKISEASPDSSQEELGALDFNSPFTRRIYQDVLSELAFERLGQIARGELEAEAEEPAGEPAGEPAAEPVAESDEATAEDTAEGTAPEPGAIIDVEAAEPPSDEAMSGGDSELETVVDSEDETTEELSGEGVEASEDDTDADTVDVGTSAASEEIIAESDEDASESDLDE